MRISSIVLILTSAAHAVAYVYAGPEHVIDPDWPVHAQFHVMQAIFWIIGLNTVAIMLAFSFERYRLSLIWWTLFVLGIFIHGSYFLAFTVGGRPEEISSHVLFIALFMTYIVALLTLKKYRIPT